MTRIRTEVRNEERNCNSPRRFGAACLRGPRAAAQGAAAADRSAARAASAAHYGH